MDYVRLGNSGLQVSRICLGMMSFGDPGGRRWVLPEEGATPIVRYAAEAGINFFDTADAYSNGASEVITGRVLRDAFASRDDYVLATKVFMPTGPGPNDRGLSRKHIMASIDASLRRLGVDYVDLYQIHRFDPHTPVEETMQALDDLVRAGKVRYLGASAMYAWQFAKLQYTTSTRFVSMQNHYNLVYREDERELLPQCADLGVGVIPFSPLARGVITGNRTPDGTRHTVRAESDSFADRTGSAADFAVIGRIREVADDRGLPVAQIALAWLLHRPPVTAPIVGATTVSHLSDAVAATTVRLTESEMQRLEELYVPHATQSHG